MTKKSIKQFYLFEAGRGRQIVNAAPSPGLLSHDNSPFIARTSLRTMLKPRPVDGSPPVGRAERRP
jgi:hypothetical protein